MRIESLRTTDGHLKEMDIEFVEGLNCIIGARGTCKSTIVETIRFLFNDETARVSELLGIKRTSNEETPSHFGLIKATLKGGTAQIVLRGEAPKDGGERIVIERDTTSESRAYVDGVKSVSDQAVLDEIEIYSQGELQEISTSPAKRLGLIDRPNKAAIDEFRVAAQNRAERIAGLGPRIASLRGVIDAAARTQTEGAPLRTQLAEARKNRPQLSPDLAAMRARHQEGERLIKAAAELADQADNDRAKVHEIARAAVSRAEAASRLVDGDGGAMQRIAGVLTRRAEVLEKAEADLRAEEDYQAIIQQMRDALDADSKPFFAALKEVEDANAALRQEDRLSEEVARLDRVATERADNQKMLDELIEQRRQLRSELSEIRSSVFALRLEEVERINSEFADQIILALNHGTRTETYRNSLDELLQGSRLRDQASLCRQLAAVLPPSDLIDYVEREDAVGLAQVLNRDEGQMLRLISHLVDQEDLYALEQDFSDDELDITMFVDGHPRSVSEMSKGQKATALLPLLLRDAPYPLVLDQPEDDLDNRFIYDTLVKTIRALKSGRQLIFVTHNANIPVIGDAERVFVMAMQTQDEALLKATGSVDKVRDDILSLLEGGPEAFELRGKTYGLAVLEPDD